MIAIVEAFNKAFASGDTNKLGQLLADDIDTKTSVLKGHFTDKASYLEAHRKWYAFGRSMVSPVELYTTYTDVKISGDSAVVTSKISWSQRGDRGLQQGVTTGITRFKRIKGEWKIVDP